MARKTIDDLERHGDFSNGVTDSSNTMDEGRMLTGQYVGRALEQIDAALSGRDDAAARIIAVVDAAKKRKMARQEVYRERDDLASPDPCTPSRSST